MEPESVALLGGLLFLLIAVVGNGFTIREIIMPGVPRWGRLASLVVGAALIVPYFASAFDEQSSGPATNERSSGPATSSTPIPSPGPRDEAIYEDSEAHVSRDAIEVSGLLASGERADVSVGERIKVQFSLRNTGSEAVTFQETFVGARNPRGDNMDFGAEHQGEELEPGQTVTLIVGRYVEPGEEEQPPPGETETTETTETGTTP